MLSLVAGKEVLESGDLVRLSSGAEHTLSGLGAITRSLRRSPSAKAKHFGVPDRTKRRTIRPAQSKPGHGQSSWNRWSARRLRRLTGMAVSLLRERRRSRRWMRPVEMLKASTRWSSVRTRIACFSNSGPPAVGRFTVADFINTPAETVVSSTLSSAPWGTYAPAVVEKGDALKRSRAFEIIRGQHIIWEVYARRRRTACEVQIACACDRCRC